ncbi:LacI family DNA-binding transcriptional regulator [Extibacter muris]|uniref:LacI family DNA-binding transcriptional regulator n=1 Tax=Extibacter muris TaxID=1796622 RepID=UPI001D064704|nr:LacI family DNA-binding transcriptional regulator [Extibacter muris]MCB6201562.1 LacI family DNA-binding transcriptional regulator [Extibacter muris]MCQ4662888.1 LacI family DNA-binding transcriptional regulator [Extibacter muris]MCQ4692697.1 LacI family DNA-binding transcriptional regulator [Extibacter muris]
MKVSVRKISEITGFSPATVSNALNHKKGVNKETADRILKTAEELGYRLDEKISKIRFVIFRRNGLIIDDSPFHPAVIEGVERQAKSLGYETVFNHVDINDMEYGTQLQEILSDTESAVVLLGTEMLEEDFEPYTHAKNKIILLDGWSDHYFFDSVLISNTDSAARAVEYLIGKGHRDIGYLRGDFRIQAFCYREIGYRRIMDRNHLPVQPEFVATVGTRIETAYEGMQRYLEETPILPTAFFADNDTIAIGAMQALKERGYDIPGDVSIIGFDNISFGAISDPPLTTINVYKHEMGEMAVRELMRAVEDGKKIKTKIQVCTDFVERASVRKI